MSEIRVDTISEKTSANGVAIDGVTIKDGGIVGATTITTADNENTLKLVCTDADQNVGPTLTLHRNSGSPADGDVVGQIQFNVQDDAPSEHGLAFIKATLSDATAGSEDGILDFNLDIAGTNRSRMTFNATEAVFNDDSQDLDFRVESNGNANAIFVNGGTDSVTIGASGVVQTVAGVPLYSADSSIYIGQDVSGTDDTAQYNVAIGFTTLDAITTGDSNVAIGYNAMTANTTGGSNISIGKSALGTNTTGSNNIAIGLDALLNPDTESNNLGIGNGALGGTIAGGEQNVAIGNYAGDAITSGDSNTLVGYNVGTSITTSELNTFIGFDVGKQHSTSAGGSVNTGVGASALQALTTGGQNTAIGGNAGYNLTNAFDNVLVGHNTGDSLILGSHNTAVGKDALGGAQGDRYNVAIGFEALKVFNTGTSVNDTENVAVGVQAGLRVTSGTANTIIGGSSGNEITTGTNNVTLGQGAGDDLTTGSNNIFLGPQSQASTAGASYQFAIGVNVTSNGNSTTTIGYDTTEIATAHGSASWAAVSDERYKKDITDSTAGLTFIDDLRPVTFKFKQKNELATDIYGYDADSTDTDGYTDEVAHGFIAQEIKAVLDNHPEIKAGQEIWKQGTDEKSNRQSVSHIGMIPMLVKAIQELSAKVKALEEA